MPLQDDVSEVTWRENTTNVTSREVQQFESIKLKFLDNVVNALMHSGFLVSAMLETLLSHYGSAKKTQSAKDVPAVVDAEKCRFERNFVKELVVREHYPMGHIAELWKMLATHHSDEVQNLLKLSQVALVLPTNTAGCERGFSTQNRNKNALRNRLKAKRLDVLMTIDIEGPPSKDFDFSTALDVWARTNRRIVVSTSN